MACAARRFLAADHQAFGDGNLRRPEHGLGALFMHGKGGSQHAGMGIGDAHSLEQALDAAVLAEAAMERVEAEIRLHFGQFLPDIAADIDARHAEALGL